MNLKTNCTALRFLLQPGRKAHPTLPPESTECVGLGIAVHLGPSLLYVGILMAIGISPLSLPAAFLLISIVNLATLLGFERIRPSVELTPPSRADIWAGLVLVFVKGALVGGSVVASTWWLGHLIMPDRELSCSWLFIFVSVFLTDVAYYLVHRMLNHGRARHSIATWFKKNHSPHHGVSALDFMRGNISSLFDTAITGFQIPLAVCAVIFGLDLLSTMAAYGLVLFLQATHHVNHTFPLGPLRFVFMDNHAHKLHHCPRGYLVNFGALFSIWDMVCGTYYEDWQLSPSYMNKHRQSLPIRSLETD